MYPGLIPMKTAARRPAECDPATSIVRRYEAVEVRPEKPGASRTHIFLMSTGKVRNLRR